MVLTITHIIGIQFFIEANLDMALPPGFSAKEAYYRFRV